MVEKIVTITAAGSGSWTCPTGVTSVKVECWGAGGAGGGNNAGDMCTGGGGGGAYARLNVFSVTPGNSYNYVIGAGGTDGSSPVDGEDTTFNATSCVAKGGASAAWNVIGTDGFGIGGAAIDSTGDVKYSGGDGGINNSNDAAGGGGGSAGPLSNGNGGGTPSGALDVYWGGAGGDAGEWGFNGSAGFAPGGGGGGTEYNQTGGVGADGQIVITYTIYTIEPITAAGSGSWTCPTGVTSVKVECWGAGGSGATSDYQDTDTGGGGGGAYSRLNAFSVTPGAVYSYYVGAGGQPADPTDGESTTFNTDECVAVGGISAYYDSEAPGGPGGDSASCIGDVVFSGGDGGSGDTLLGGGGGGSAGPASDGNDGAAGVGATGVAGGGSGGNPGYGDGINGSNGAAPGGGGGGVYGSAIGGIGATGQIKFTYTAVNNFMQLRTIF